MKAVINFVIFQLGWFICVASVARQLEWLALFSILVAIATHLLIVKQPVTELQLILVAGILGLAVDSTLISLGVFNPENIIGIDGLAPLWLVSLWMLFSITINHSMRWLQGRYVIAAILGFIFAPVAYLAGQKLGALTFPSDNQQLISLLIIGSCWLVVTPFLLLSSQYISRRHLGHNYS